MEYDNGREQEIAPAAADILAQGEDCADGMEGDRMIYELEWDRHEMRGPDVLPD
jgi:hypothetical protein